ncbi:unnamed protein product [Brassicogethes aeneus]|uniref:Uncharacterized protein n=1 Tax=Brassicogethes aeneus TaxID=1431903 RepID=A0A9P0B796_BRAAE|nr:unnamed protein product [Brassicogethes aeneus]
MVAILSQNNIYGSLLDNAINMGFSHNRTLKDVLNGSYPKNKITKMDVYDLELFVTKLVQCTKQIVSKTLGKEVNEKPSWWPTALELQYMELCKAQKKRKIKATILQRLVIKCSKYFKKYACNYNSVGEIFVNDENICITKKNRKVNQSTKNKLRINKGKNDMIANRYPIIKLEDILRKPTARKPVTQNNFLNYFGLLPSSTEKEIKPDQYTFPSHPIKIHNSHHIPLSSDLGQMLLKRENHQLNETVLSRRLERVEWYINKAVPKEDAKYEPLQSIPALPKHCHQYRYPKRQYHQVYKDNNKKLQLCKPLKVVLKKCDFSSMKKKCLVKLERISNAKRKSLVVKLEKIEQCSSIKKKLRRKTK